MISGVSGYTSYYTGSTLAKTQTASGTTGTQAGSCAGNQGKAKFDEDLFKSIDNDGDGNITKDELTTALSSSDDSDSSDIDIDDLLSQLDSDGSGGVSQSELSAAMPPPPPPGGMGGPSGAGSSGEDLISSLDTDGDGVISADELAASGSSDDSDKLSQLFGKLDSDGSGGISSDELASAFKAEGRGDGPPPPPPSGNQSADGSSTRDAYQKLVANLLKQYQSSDATALQASSGSLVNIAA